MQKHNIYFFMNILISNDDGYTARGIKALVEIMRPFGHITVVAPKFHQSGTSMAINLGLKPIAVKKVSSDENEDWYYLDGTPSSCIKFGIDNIMYPVRPDVVVSGINHGANFATAALYSATLGAAKEGAINGIPAIGVSIDDLSEDADFSPVRKLFPEIFKKLMDNFPARHGLYYNINFPALAAPYIKGIIPAHMGMAHWEREYQPYDISRLRSYGISNLREEMSQSEPGEDLYMMAGDFVEDDANDALSDHRLVKQGYVSITAHNIDDTDYEEVERIKQLFG